MKKFGAILAVCMGSILSSLFLIGNENLIIRIASAPFLMIAIFCVVWLVQQMGKRPDAIEKRLVEEAEKREAERNKSEDLPSA